MQLKVNHVLILLCLINFFNFFDRGIIPGAPIQFQAFIQSSHNVSPSHVSVYMGVLQTSFIASLSVFVCIFGYLSRTNKPFVLAGTGLSIWALALLCCGISKSLNSFTLLLCGRIASGIGEASFQSTAPAIIDEFAPPSKRTLWMGIFFAAVPVGQAIGFASTSLFASSIGWDFGFYITAIIAVPLVTACWRWIPSEINQPLSHVSTAHNEANGETLLTEEKIQPKMSFIKSTLSILSTPIFVTATIGWTAYAFTIGGLSTFAPVILIGLDVLDDSVASIVVGGLVVLSGLLGALFGGYLLDRFSRGHEQDTQHRIQTAAMIMFGGICCGIVFLLSSLFVLSSPAYVILILLFLGLFAVFLTQAPLTIVILLSVPWCHRGYALGLNTLLMHLFGDVPVAVVLGALKDRWAPHCGSTINSDGSEALDPLCNQDKHGLRTTLVFAYTWLGLAVVAWGATFLIARKHAKVKEEKLRFPMNHVLVLLVAINFLNFFERGIIPGAPIQFQAFIAKAHNVSSNHVSLYFGVLQTSFIASLSVFVCIFGYLSRSKQPFLLTSIGLFIWILSSVCCAISKPIESYSLLLFGRLISGIGEASFQATAPAFIDQFAPPAKRTLWLGLFFAFVAVGEAVGFSLSSVIAATVGWDISFYLTTVLAIPLVYMCYWCIPDELNKPLANTMSNRTPILNEEGLLLNEIKQVSSCRGHEDDQPYRLKMASLQMLVAMSSGVVFFLVSLCFISYKPWVSLILLTIGLLFVLTTQAPLTTVVLLSVRWSQRNFAIGVNTFLMHLLGDVPAVVILGAMKDALAPNCGSEMQKNGEAKLDPNCHLDKSGLRSTLAFSYAWLLWAVVFWVATYYITRKRSPSNQVDMEIPRTPTSDW
ncbi:Major Facilitator Superfamily (MFS) [Thraustotheca clavata]|uniref:Major Facilitator Superfamily (MFS) n=1 Tax=Thraustotheca clavata TaxID=74557 RepID=A0A1V9Y7B8_9STRA|nr:Major Facilitator Superfamily (MFS) [Thraustotheca clavata]